MGNSQAVAVQAEFIPENIADEILTKYFTPDHPAAFTADILRRVLLDAITFTQLHWARFAAQEARYWSEAGSPFSSEGMAAASNICAAIVQGKSPHKSDSQFDQALLLAQAAYGAKKHCARLVVDATRAKADAYSREGQIFMAAAAHASGAEAEEAILKSKVPDASEQLTPAQLREIFRKIAAGERAHGDFLTTFAQAFIRADAINELVLLPAALMLARRNNLESYAQPDDEQDEAVQA